MSYSFNNPNYTSTYQTNVSYSPPQYIPQSRQQQPINNQYIYTGYYGMPNQEPIHIQPQQQAQSFFKSVKQKKWKAAAFIFNNNMISSANKSNLYQKPNAKPNQRRLASNNKQDLVDKYNNQKKAELEFNKLQYQIKYVEYMVKLYPYLASYYNLWLAQAQETLKNYTNIIESPDVVSFSSVFGFSKDEELVTLYRHPIFQNELNKTCSYRKSLQKTWPVAPEPHLRHHRSHSVEDYVKIF